jgi:Tol biopolymer transport system component
MLRSKITRIELTLLAGCIITVLAVLFLGRTLRANAPEIAFLRNQNDVYVLDVERGLVRQIAHTDYAMNTPRWSPDGRNLTFTVIDGSGTTSIQRLDANGTIHELFHEKAPIWSTAWSPDSDEVAFIADEDLFVINADGTDLRQLHSLLDVRSYSLTWSPDGENLAFISSGMITRPYIYMLNVHGQPDTELAVTSIPANSLALPSWSPDSKELAFVSGEQLYIAGTDGKERLIAEADIPRASAWSADGRLAYINNLQLHVASRDGSIQPLDTDLKVNRSPVWSPDAEDLAFASGGDLYLIDPVGGAPRLITPDDDSRAITDFAWRR